MAVSSISNKVENDLKILEYRDTGKITYQSTVTENNSSDGAANYVFCAGSFCHLFMDFTVKGTTIAGGTSIATIPEKFRPETYNFGCASHIWKVSGDVYVGYIYANADGRLLSFNTFEANTRYCIEAYWHRRT